MPVVNNKQGGINKQRIKSQGSENSFKQSKVSHNHYNYNSTNSQPYTPPI